MNFRRASSLVGVNLVLLSTFAACLEWYASAHRPSPMVDLVTDANGRAKRFKDDSVLGYALIPNATLQWTRTIGTEEVFTVTYRVNAHGFRVTPASSSSRCVLFFGDSFTFGAGLRDEETIPFRVGLARPDVQVYNLGVPGYGVQQSLAAVEHGLLDRLPCTPIAAFFLTIPDHLTRAVRPVGWQGPRYVLDAGQVRNIGRFDPSQPSRLERALKRSWAARRWILPLWDGRMSQADLDLTVGMLTALQSKLPCPLTVLHWDAPSRHGDQMLAALKASSLTVTALSEWLPGLQTDPTRWQLHAQDAHPNALAAAKIASDAARQVR